MTQPILFKFVTVSLLDVVTDSLVLYSSHLALLRGHNTILQFKHCRCSLLREQL